MGIRGPTESCSDFVVTVRAGLRATRATQPRVC